MCGVVVCALCSLSVMGCSAARWVCWGCLGFSLLCAPRRSFVPPSVALTLGLLVLALGGGVLAVVWRDPVRGGARSVGGWGVGALVVRSSLCAAILGVRRWRYLYSADPQRFNPWDSKDRPYRVIFFRFFFVVLHPTTNNSTTMKAQPNWTKGDVHDTLTIERKAVTWTVSGRTVTAKPCKDGRGGYWIKAANIARAAWVRRVDSCFDCEGIAAFLASTDAQAARVWTFDRNGNAHRYTFA